MAERNRDEHGRFAPESGSTSDRHDSEQDTRDAEDVGMGRRQTSERIPGQVSVPDRDSSFDDAPIAVKEAKPHKSNVMNWVKSKFGRG